MPRLSCTCEHTSRRPPAVSQREGPPQTPTLPAPWSWTRSFQNRRSRCLSSLPPHLCCSVRAVGAEAPTHLTLFISLFMCRCCVRSGWTFPVPGTGCTSGSEVIVCHLCTGLSTQLAGEPGHGVLITSVASEPNTEPGLGQALSRGSQMQTYSEDTALTLSQGTLVQACPQDAPGL